MTDKLTAADILAMPLTELRERVELAERLAMASRHASSPGAGGTPAAVASPTGGKATAPQTAAAGKPASPAAAKNPTPAAAAAPSADEAALGEGSGTAASSGDDDLTFGGDGSGSGDDMLAGFVEEVTPEQAKTKAVEIAKQVIAKKENSELAIARGIMQKYGVSKVSEVPAGKEVELYNDFKAGFPQYVAG